MNDEEELKNKYSWKWLLESKKPKVVQGGRGKPPRPPKPSRNPLSPSNSSPTSDDCKLESNTILEVDIPQKHKKYGKYDHKD